MSYYCSSALLRRGGGRALEGLRMKKIDPAFLFELGDQLRRVRLINGDSELVQAWVTFDTASKAIEQAVGGSIYTPLLHEPCRAAANSLVARMRAMNEKIFEQDWATEKLVAFDVQVLQNHYTKFETLPRRSSKQRIVSRVS